MKDNNKLINKNRRDFLSMVSKSGISASVIKSSSLVAGLMATRFAHAQNNRKRVVFVYTTNGAPNGMWLPNGNALNVATRAYEGLQSVCHFREAEVVGSGHGLNRKSLGQLKWGSGELDDTIDQQIARCISSTMPYQHYMLGVQTAGGDSISRLLGASVPVENSPAGAYQKLFGSAPPAGGAQQLLARKRSVLDAHQAALTEIKSKLSTEERQLISTHEQALTNIYNRLENSANQERPEGCTSPAWNSKGYDTQGPAAGGEVGVFGHQAELMADIITAAFQCDLTNVMTLQLGHDQAAWYGHDTAYNGDHHGSCHAAPAEANAEMTNYLSRCVAYLVKKLRDTDDPAVPGTKLLQNTVVVQVTDMGDGRDHTAANGPHTIATQMPSFRVGQATRSSGNNLQFLEGVAHGLGLSSFIGKSGSAKIWPCGGDNPDTAILS